MKTIDLRSDTATIPTDEMRDAMYSAALGDDVNREDPTVNALEEKAARMLGKEAALFTVSGTMSNLLAVLTHTSHGEEIILGSGSHIFLNEVGGAAALGGVMVRTVPNAPNGELGLADIEGAIRGQNIHLPRTSLLCLENTQNVCGGTVLTPAYTSAAAALAHERGLRVHMDGARIFNAAVALDVPASDLVCDVDSVCFCLSKGLSAPVGSVLCGSHDFISSARRWRKMVGGGMRQAGVIAAAGIVALDAMVDRLQEDHDNARRLARGLADTPGLTVRQPDPPTNIVMCGPSPEMQRADIVGALGERGVKVGPRGGGAFRAVTHRMTAAEDVEEALERTAAAMRSLGA